VRLPADRQFLREVEHFDLHFTCESCLFFVASEKVCGNGWPTDEHRRVPEAGELVVFCKEFEVA
jgi:hypothetical protein